MTFAMQRCRFCAQGGQSLAAVARHWFGADWIQLWGANPGDSARPPPPPPPAPPRPCADLSGAPRAGIKNPDALEENALLRLGPMYRVQGGDTLARLAARFGMSPRQMHALNPDAAVLLPPLPPPALPPLPPRARYISAQWLQGLVMACILSRAHPPIGGGGGRRCTRRGRGLTGMARAGRGGPPSPPSRTKWTRLVHPSVLIGHVSRSWRFRWGSRSA